MLRTLSTIALIGLLLTPALSTPSTASTAFAQETIDADAQQPLEDDGSQIVTDDSQSPDPATTPLDVLPIEQVTPAAPAPLPAPAAPAAPAVAAPTATPAAVYRGDPRGVAVHLNDFEPGWVLTDEFTDALGGGVYSATFSLGVGTGGPSRTIDVVVFDTTQHAQASWETVRTKHEPGWLPISTPSFGDATIGTTSANGVVGISSRIKNVIVSSSGIGVDAPAQMVGIMAARVLALAR